MRRRRQARSCSERATEFWPVGNRRNRRNIGQIKEMRASACYDFRVRWGPRATDLASAKRERTLARGSSFSGVFGATFVALLAFSAHADDSKKPEEAKKPPVGELYQTVQTKKSRAE